MVIVTWSFLPPITNCYMQLFSRKQKRKEAMQSLSMTLGLELFKVISPRVSSKIIVGQGFCSIFFIGYVVLCRMIHYDARKGKQNIHQVLKIILNQKSNDRWSWQWSPRSRNNHITYTYYLILIFL